MESSRGRGSVKSGGDPFGSAVLHHSEGRRDGSCTIERDDGFTTTEDLDPYFEGEELWTPQEIEALGKAKIPVLDMGCGPGRHLIDLQRRGFAVGLDISTTVLEVCRKRGGRLLVLGRITRLPFKGRSFATALMMGNGLGLAGGVETTLKGLGEVHRILRDSGLIIAHTSDPLDPESGIHEEYRLQNISRGKPPGLLRIRVAYGGVTGQWFNLMLMPKADAVSILERSGFAVQRALRWDSSIIFVARKSSPSERGPRHLLRRLAGLIAGS
jgi:SAM-dependent methyltransferase